VRLTSPSNSSDPDGARIPPLPLLLPLRPAPSPADALSRIPPL
jgi:hypothetical protein